MMPKFGAHMIFAERAAQARPDLFGRCNNELRLGAIGPDMVLFLLDPLKLGPAREVLNEVLEALEKVSAIETEMDRIAEKFDTDLADWLTGGLSTDLVALAETSFELLLSTLKLSLANAASSISFKNPLAGLNIDPEKFSDPKYVASLIEVIRSDSAGFPFRYFGHPYTNDPGWKNPEPVGDYTDWWWMDLLHYRLPGTFATNLKALASTNAQRSYASGYMTHVAGDITGHPFINTLVEGPFRNHAYRHIVVEGLADTYLWEYAGKGDIANSRLQDYCAVSPASLREISELISRALEETYKAPMVPAYGYPTADDIESAYYLMIRYLKLSTSKTAKRPTPPPDSLEEVWAELEEIFKQAQPGSLPPWDPSDPSKMLLAILEWAWKGLVLLVMISTLPVALGARIASLPARWVVYFLHLAIYLLLSAVRTMLALMGWSYASSEDFSNFGFLKRFITAPNTDGYPFSIVPNKSHFYWLQHPRLAGAGIEADPTFVGAIPPGSRPGWLLDRSNVMQPNASDLLYATNPSATRAILKAMPSAAFGNPIDFAIALASGNFPVPDFDLDGDRGYAYRPWEEYPPNERYL